MSLPVQPTVSFFETSKGYIALGNKQIMQLDNMSFTVNVAEEEVSSFSSQFETYFVPTKKKYDISADFIVDTSNSAMWHFYSGSTTSNLLTGNTSGFDLVEMARNRAQVTIVIKVDSAIYYTGNAILTSVDLKIQTAQAMKGSCKISVTGGLTKATS